ncbi:hypothetical protein ACA910_022434 [Epithemia clementina (nom. ined.)]
MSSNTNPSSSPSPSSQSTSPLLLSYVPLGNDELTEYVELYERCMEDVKAQWKQESDKYEETIPSNLPGHPKEIPRRNYANPEGIVQDSSLFPYHSSCYMLLEAYDALYEGSDHDNTGAAATAQHHQPIPKNSILPSAIRQTISGHNNNDSNLVEEPPRVVVQEHHHDDDEKEGDDEEEDATFLLCSLQSIMFVFFRRRIEGQAFVQTAGLSRLVVDVLLRMLQQQQQQNSTAAPMLEEDKVVAVDEWALFPEESESDLTVNTIPQLPADETERRVLLLSLLKHSLSELQRDHMLAAAVLVRLALDQSLNHVPTFQRILTILCSEYVLCTDFECDEPEDHDCDLWKLFLEVVEAVLFHGPGFLITREHALSMAAFCRYSYWREYGHLSDIATTMHVPNSSSNNKQQQVNNSQQQSPEQHALLLKRYLLANRMEDNQDLEEPATDPEKQNPARLLLSLIRSWGRRGERELARIAFVLEIHERQQEQLQQRNGEEDIQPQPSLSNESIARYLDSYHNCVRSLVSVALASAQVLPKSERLYQIASTLIRAIASSLIHIEVPCPATGSKSLMDHDSTYYLGAPTFPQLESIVLSLFRLANRIRQATELERAQNFRLQATTYTPGPGDDNTKKDKDEDWSSLLLAACRKAVHGRPHENIREAVRMLFLRDAVYMSMAGMGYGDFVVWCRFRVQPLDLVMFYHDCNHIMPDDVDDDENEDDSDNDDDEDDSELDEEEEFKKPVAWAQNEDGVILAGELWCHFNFSLLAMVCAWREPWTPSSHMSFSSQYRTSAVTLALCLERHCSTAMPKEVLRTIISYLPREAWVEDDNFCWHYECSMQQTATKMFLPEDESSSNNNNRKQYKLTCKRCGIPRYCSKSCLEQDRKDMHRRICIEPPYCPINKEHIAFCQSIEDGSYKKMPNANNPPEKALQAVKDVNEADNCDDDDDDDDGSWESVDSDEEEQEENKPEDQSKPPSLTKVVTQFMRNHRRKNP